MQQLRRLVKARRPPTLLVSTVLQRVWSPPTGEELTVSLLPLSCPHSLHGVTLTEQHRLCTALAQNGLKDAQQRLGQLLLQVVLGVDGQAVLQHKQGVLWAGRGYRGVRGSRGQYPRGVTKGCTQGQEEPWRGRRGQKLQAENQVTVHWVA